MKNEKSVSRSARNFYDLPEFRRRFSEGYKEIGGRVYELACAEYFEVLLSFYLDACVLYPFFYFLFLFFV